jgi:hypothetical protein
MKEKNFDEQMEGLGVSLMDRLEMSAAVERLVAEVRKGRSVTDMESSIG